MSSPRPETTITSVPHPTLSTQTSTRTPGPIHIPIEEGGSSDDEEEVPYTDPHNTPSPKVTHMQKEAEEFTPTPAQPAQPQPQPAQPDTPASPKKAQRRKKSQVKVSLRVKGGRVAVVLEGHGRTKRSNRRYRWRFEAG